MSRREGVAARTIRVSALALGVRRYRRIAVAVALGYLLVYLLAIQNLIVSPGTDLSRFVPIPSVRVATDWTSKVLKQVAPFYFEPVVAIYPVNHVTVLVSPVNMAMGAALGALVGVNVAVALLIVRTARACRTRAFTGLLGALPGFLTGFACCVPTVALLIGAQLTVALVALRTWFFPIALAALALSLVWNARRAWDLADTPSPAGMPVAAPAGREG